MANPAKPISQAAQEKEWQQQDDAHALARAEEIKKDPARVKGASIAAKKMYAEAQEKAAAMKKVAGIKSSSQQKRVQIQSKSTPKKK